MANMVYNNFYLANEVEDQFNSHLDLTQFATARNELQGQPGMKYTIHKYSATDSVAKVQMGSGNVSDSESRLTSVDYNILTAQGRFMWYDEEEKKDPIAITTGVAHLGTDLFNTINADVYAELKKATKVVPVQTFGFNAFADAMSMFNSEDNAFGDMAIFGLVCPADVAELRKQLKDELKYVEAFARTGYVGTVAGVNIFTKKDATPGTITLATKEAVTIFNKTGIEYEGERTANTRQNRSYVRKYYVVALTDERKAVKVIKATATATQDTTVTSGKTYYAADGLGYVVVTPEEGANPKTKGWYEIA